MRVIILGGFLGSGKTTALMQFARFLAEVSPPERENKVVILENEVGEVGIDDKLLRSGGFKVDNLFAGCACCTASVGLVSAAIRIKYEMNPEWLVIETTGIAYPKYMRDNLRDAAKLDSRICVLVDAQRWGRLIVPMNHLFRGQIEGSDAVLINKTDLVDEETLQKIERDIHGFESNASIFRISALGSVPSEIWRSAAGI